MLALCSDVQRQLVDTCCKEAARAVNDGPLSARSWAWFHFLHQLIFTERRQMSTVYVCSFELVASRVTMYLSSLVEVVVVVVGRFYVPLDTKPIILVMSVSRQLVALVHRVTMEK